jgi:hypothetical protein
VVDQVTEQLANVNNSNEITAKFRCKLAAGSSIVDFKKFYNDLTQVFRRKPGRDTDFETDSSHIPAVFPLSLRHSSPDVTSPASTDSRESGPEHHTNSCAKAFLWGCHKTLECQLEQLA